MYAGLIATALAIAPITLVPRQQGTVCLGTITCPGNNGCSSTAANGAVFQLKCTTNFNGPVIEVNQAASFVECVTACSVVSGCKGLNYKGRFCYLLGNTINVGPTISVSNVNGATRTKTATAKPSPTAGSSTCTTAIACPTNEGCKHVANNKSFYTRCAFDLYGGDMANGSSRQANMTACVDKCSTTTGSVAVSYSTSDTFYLKSSLKPAVYSANMNGAYIK